MNRLKESKELLESASLFNDLLVQQQDDKTTATEAKAGGNAADVHAFSGDQLAELLSAMCQRAGFQGAAVVDEQGLTYGMYNSPVEGKDLSALTTLLADAMGKAGRLLDQYDANTISMAINSRDKGVLQKFAVGDNSFFVLVFCEQELDERSEVELSIEQLTATLKKR